MKREREETRNQIKCRTFKGKIERKEKRYVQSSRVVERWRIIRLIRMIEGKAGGKWSWEAFMNTFSILTF